MRLRVRASRTAVCIVAFLLFQVVGCSNHASRPRESESVADRFPTADGSMLALSEFTGKVVLLTFGATWCPMCAIEMRDLQRVHRRLAPEGLQVVAVLIDESIEDVASFVRENGITYPVLKDRDGRLQGQFKISSLPVTVALDARGQQIPLIDPETEQLVDQIDGPRSWDKAKEISLLRQLLLPAR